MKEFVSYAWPGNVREMANLIEAKGALLAEDGEEIDTVPTVIRNWWSTIDPRSEDPSLGSGGEPDEIVPLVVEERRIFKNALERCHGNVEQAARALGVAKGTVYNKIRRYKLQGIARDI